MNNKKAEMSFWEHLEELRKRIIYCLATVCAIAIFCFIFGLREVSVGGITLYYPFPELYDNINTLVFNQIRNDLIRDPRIQLIPIGIADPVVVQLEISLFLGILFGMPMIVYQLGKFVAPGLYPHEKAILIKTAFPATFLFALGCAFAYFIIIPFTIDFLYGFAFAMDIQPFLSLESFISFVIIFLIAYGLVFELPIIMVGLTRLGVVSAQFWRENWRYAFVGMVIFGAIVTPDGSGITQLIVAIPMMLLYVIGYLIAKRLQKG
ncbi:MAG: twin-arginine translocase subunit TatC [Thermoplasmata archaeon]|nr:MAG: twin-arginine translocase subunit TatC [Thermoplasmata archaeon]